VTQGRLDPVVVRRHLRALDQAVAQLRKHAGQPLAALDDLDELWTVERGLHLCCQNCLDIATHICASEGRDAADYASAIDALGQLGALPREFGTRFRDVAGFRNLLVHGYLAVDTARLHDVLNHHLDDFVDFARHVEEYLSAPA
jgi:uncharacterized protein YutE (UPF0331/DUF86 family)